jgi:hypothetical protein
MAGVKAKRGGPSLRPVWTVTDCSECGQQIDYTDPKRQTYPAVRVQVITFTGAKGSSRLQWRHKGCVK